MVLAGTQVISNVGDTARFGSILFQILAPIQLAILLFLSAMTAASAVAQEKDKKNLVLLLLTRMSNHELVLGKLFSSLLNIFVMLLAALPLFMLITLFGGVSVTQIIRVYAVTAVTTFAAGSLGSLFAFWREKTFQTLAMTSVAIVVWLAICEAIGAGIFGREIFGVSHTTWAAGGSPLRAILEAVRPTLSVDSGLGAVGNSVHLHLIVSFGIAIILNYIAISRVRIWNPSNEVRRQQASDEVAESIWGPGYVVQGATNPPEDEEARRGHVDARATNRQIADAKTRQVWDNPIIWREICTQAHGRKIIVIRVTYLLFGVAVGWYLIATSAASGSNVTPSAIPTAAESLVPFFLVSLVIINALAVTSITGERDGLALDLLLATDLMPREFVFGKLGGVFYVTKEMVIAPLVICIALWIFQGLSFEHLCYLCGGLLVLDVFVAMLGIHLGMAYANSRTAITLSLGTVFFLFLGVATCIMMMISFSGSFQVQLAPFLTFILGGSLGLYVSLGARNPSTAILLASLLVPFMTFYAIVSFLLHYTLALFLVTTVTFGYTTAAMLVPALYEFDFAMGRTTTPE